MDEFANRIAIITGGARGLGKAFASALVQQGAHVVIADLDAAEARKVAEALGSGAEAFALDVADEAAVARAFADVAQRHGGIDIVINNAGIHSAEANRHFGDMGITAVRQMFEVNVWGVVYCTLAAAPHMQGREGATIVNIASMASYAPSKAYGVSKLAVRGLTVSFAHELAPLGIRVNAVAPGLIFTDTIRAELPPPMVDQVLATQILKQQGEEEDIVNAVLHLASSRSKFVTGETWRVSGGATLQV